MFSTKFTIISRIGGFSERFIYRELWRNQEPGIKNLESRTWNQETRIKKQESRVLPQSGFIAKPFDMEELLQEYRNRCHHSEKDSSLKGLLRKNASIEDLCCCTLKKHFKFGAFS